MAERVKFELPVESVTALQHHGRARTFGLLLFADGVANDGSRVEGATGVGIAAGDRRFVATAGHNLIGVPDDGLVLVHEDHVAYRATPILRRWPEADDSQPEPDLGYIEISKDVADASPKDFVPTAQIRPDFNHVDISVIMLGHPAERVPQDLIRSQRLINLRAMAFATRSVELPADRDAANEFALAVRNSGYDAESGEPIETPELSGISGAGVWLVPRPGESGIWSPSEAILVGIEHSWLRKSQMVLCNQMKSWLSLVARDYPDLALETQAAGH